MALGKDTTGNIKPSKSLLKRIDIGLTTAVCAVFISLLALVVGKKEIDIALEAHKATILPIIDIDMGYIGKPNEKGVTKKFYEVTLSNVGAGIAHIQKVVVLQHGKAVENYPDFESAIMTGRMLSWSTLVEEPAAGYLRAGDAVSPVSYRIGGAEGDLSAYLRGKWGKPMDQVDLEVCYCSVLDDCWTVSYLDRKAPKSVASCGIEERAIDYFQNYIDQRFEARNSKS